MMNKIDCFDGKYAFLSNYYNSPIHQELSDGSIIEYPTVEHAFQAAKTLDINERYYIASLPTPGKAKRAGRNVTLRKDWNQIKTDVMLSFVRGKFEWPDLQKKLLATGDIYLEEGNTWHDNIWGNCSCYKCANIQGENRLGKILMQVRQEAKEGRLPVFKDA